jgi:ABC-type transport system involved in multi-copper enzyme maturation permease subunit
MLGPVLQQELLLASRRGRHMIFRRVYTGLLVVQLVVTLFLYSVERHFSLMIGRHPPTISDYAEPLFSRLLLMQFLLIVLATPAYTAGAITDEKSRGTIQYLLTTGLTSWEILLGKLFGRTATVATLALASLPLFCFLVSFTGVGFVLLLVFFAALATPLLAAGAAGLLASVWCRTTRDAVLAVYLVGLVAAILLWSVGWLHWVDPLEVVTSPAADDWSASELAGRLLKSAAIWGTVGVVCLGLAIWRLRGAYTRQLETQKPGQAVRWWGTVRPPVGDDALAWKERYIEGLGPLAALRRVPRWIGVTAVFAATLAGFTLALWNCRQPGVTWETLAKRALALDLPGLQEHFVNAGSAIVTPNVLLILVASLLVGVRASGAVTGERERQTWEGLLLSPLTARQLLRGKLWGIIRATYPYLAAYAVPALALSLAGGYWPVLLTVVSLVAAWLAMWVLGSVGLWCSVRARSSWRSLVWTLLVGYAAAFVSQGLFMALVSVAVVVIWVVLTLVDGAYGTRFAPAFVGFSQSFVVMSYVALVGVALVLPWWFLRDAQRRVAYMERVRRWPGRVERKTYASRKPRNLARS